MSLLTFDLVIAIILLLQGLSHGKAALDLIGVVTGRNDGYTLPVRIRLLPSISLKTSALIAGIFWILATVGFVAAALGAFGNLDLGAFWKPLAGLSAIISTVGIVLVGGTWPAAHTTKLSKADTIIALVINAALIVSLLFVG